MIEADLKFSSKVLALGKYTSYYALGLLPQTDPQIIDVDFGGRNIRYYKSKEQEDRSDLVFLDNLGNELHIFR